MLTRDEVRDVDRRAIHDFGLPGIVLMEHAGRGASEAIVRAWPQLQSEATFNNKTLIAGVSAGRVAIVCGKGNNAGDGFVMARWLDLFGFSVEVWLAAGDAFTGDAALAWNVLRHCGIAIRNCPQSSSEAVAELSRAELIVDAILGTGAAGTVREPILSKIRAINQSQRPIVAIDLPSGLDANTGQPLGVAVRATTTLTFVAPKTGFAQPAAAEYLGRVEVIDIGVPRALLAEFGLAPEPRSIARSKRDA